MSFSCVIRSRDRLFGTPNAFNVQILDLPKGTYKTTFTLVTSDVTVSELQVRWNGIQTHSSNAANSFNTVLISGPLRSVGTTHFIDPGSDVYIQYTDVSTNLLRTNMPETVITVFFEAV